MADDEVHLPDDLLSPKLLAAYSPFADKDKLTSGNGNYEERGCTDFLDENKGDQVISENSIPLSPQWLYTKPTESKTGAIPSTLDGRQANPFSHGVSSDPSQKDSWRLDASHDKREWRRNASDHESSRRWREEERETGLLGRRERRKESERDSEYRKSDRRSENISTRETPDSRTLLTSDRWHELPGRNSGHDNRRDTKWSSRWGPEEKEKDARAEKKMELEKEESYNEKSFVGGNRQMSESDSRDKWRPRHRLDSHSINPTGFRAAPGFGLDKGRGEASNIGFASGRGRSNMSVGSVLGRSSGPIGVTPMREGESLHGSDFLSPVTFRYPRGKLLDIYRNHRTSSSFIGIPKGFVEIPPLTYSCLTEPLAFVQPSAEEGEFLDDIWKGKVTSSETSLLSNERMSNGSCNETVHGDVPNTETKHSNASEEGMYSTSLECSTHEDMLDPSKASNFCAPTVPVIVETARKDCGVTTDAFWVGNDEHVEHSVFLETLDPKRSHAPKITDISASLPDDASSLFDTFVPEILEADVQDQYPSEVMQVEQIPPAEELGLFYKDPQGDIQGPFLYVDIISWFEQGFFGLDLPVCLSEDTESRRFQPLGVVMPHLKMKLGSLYSAITDNKCELSGAVINDVDGQAAAADFDNSLMKTGHHLSTSGFENQHGRQGVPHIYEHEDYMESGLGRLIHSSSEASCSIPGPEKPCPNYDSSHDIDEVLYTGRTAASSGSTSSDILSGLHNISRLRNGHRSLPGGIGEYNLSNPNQTADELHTLGLLLSRLEGSHSMQPLPSNIDDQTQRVKREQFNISGDQEKHSSSYRRSSLNVIPSAQYSTHFTQAETDSDRFRVEDHWRAQQLQKEQQLQHLQKEQQLQQLQKEQQLQRLQKEQLLQEQQLQQLQKEQLLQQLLSHQNIHINGPVLEQPQSYFNHQQSLHTTLPVLDQILNRQLQYDRLQELQKQQQQQLQQQEQFRLRQLQLLQRQQMQQQQLLHEQLMHQPPCDRRQGNAMSDNLQHRLLVLQELQQQAQVLSHTSPTMEQALARLGHHPGSLHEQHNDMIDALTLAKRRQTIPFSQEILLRLQQEQLQARQLGMAAQQNLVMEDGRHSSGLWSGEQSAQVSQLIRETANIHHVHPGGLRVLDGVEPSQSSFDLRGHLDRNLSLHEPSLHGLFENSVQHFDREIPTPSVTRRPNAHLLNALSHAQGIDVHEQHNQINFLESDSQFSSTFHPLQMSDQYSTLEADFIRARIMGCEGKNISSTGQFLSSKSENLSGTDFQTVERLKNYHSFVPTLASAFGGNVDKSNHDFADVLHNKQSLEHSQSFQSARDVPSSSYGIKESSRIFPRTASDQSFNFLPNKMNPTNSFSEGPNYSVLGQSSCDRMMSLDMEGHFTSISGGGKPPLGPLPASSADSKQFLAKLDEAEKQQVVDYMSGDAHSDKISLSDVSEEDRPGYSKSSIFNWSSLDVSGTAVEQSAYEMRLDNDYREKRHNDRSPHCNAVPFGLHSVSPASSFDNSFKGNNEDGRVDSKGFHAEAPFSNQKGVRSHRATSWSDADLSEASFVDMLRSTKKPSVEADIPSGVQESAQGGKSGKKKGKKGRQIDPSLLGFKVHSNRIMMGEIQRPDD